jgi:Resolvase, N terminal domain
VFGLKSSRRVQLGQSAALYCRVSTADQTCARQERDLRAFAKKAGYKVVGVWKEIASGAKQERAERKKVLALAQARKVDVILVTELTRWGRSAGFAARSLTCLKFRFVSSPLPSCATGFPTRHHPFSSASRNVHGAVYGANLFFSTRGLLDPLPHPKAVTLNERCIPHDLPKHLVYRN